MSKKNVDWKELEASIMSKKEFNVEKYIPKEFIEHYNVKKPIGIRVHKQDCRITHVLPESTLQGKAFVGDSVLSVDNKPISNGDELQQKLKAKTEKEHLTIRHSNWSWCCHLKTTVEKFKIDRDVEKITSKPVNHYFVLLKVKSVPELPLHDLGISVKYNTRDRLEIVAVKSNSIASVHLRPGDVIRECNDQSIASKSMLRFLISEGINKCGQVTFFIEAPIGDFSRDHIEISDDVVQIADKEIASFKKTLNKMRSNLKPHDPKKPNKKVKYSEKEMMEFQIVSDVDPTKLKTCKNAS